MPTTNPVPSQDPSDLLFNAGKLDEVVNGSNATYTDRLGVSRRTMAGVDAAADVVLGGLGYAPPVAYAAGIALTLTTQTVEYAGEVYAPKVSVLPFTTSGTFETAKFRLIQGVASADLASGGGAAMVGYTPAGTGAVATTVQSELRRTVHAENFGAVGYSLWSNTNADASIGLQKAIDHVALLGGGDVRVTPGLRYRINTQVTLKVGVRLVGALSNGVPDQNYTALPVFDVTVGSGATTTPAFLYRNASGMSGVAFNYPEQVAKTSATPTQYGWTLHPDLAWAGAGSLDSVSFKNLYAHNPYIFMNLDKAGRFDVENVHGQPLYRGIFVDRVYDVPRMKNVHFWTFYCAPGDSLYSWVYTNGKAYEFSRVDDLHAWSLFCYGYQTGFHFSDSGNGYAWITGDAFLADVCGKPFLIDKVSRVRLTGATGTGNGVQTAFSTSNDIAGDLTLVAPSAYGVAFGAILRSNTGTSRVISPAMKIGASDCRCWTVFPAGSAPIYIDNAAVQSLLGSSSTVYDGVQLCGKKTNVSPLGFSDWSGWSSNARNASGVLTLAGGVDSQRFTLPASITQERGPFVLSFDVNVSGAYSSQGYQFYIRVRDGNYNVVANFYPGTEFAPDSLIHIDWPFILSQVEENVIEIVWGTTSGSGVTSVNITNLKLWRGERKTTSQVLIEKLNNLGNFLNSSDTPIGLEWASGQKRIWRNAAPTAGTWQQRDVVSNQTPTVGQPKAWVCTASGAPGTWVSDGNL